MKYYKAGEMLIQYNSETHVYRQGNTVASGSNVIPTEIGDALENKVAIKKAEYSRLMNIFFKDVAHTWVYKGVRYRKIPNFEVNGHNCANYKFAELPKHTFPDRAFSGPLLFVYHWGKPYYFLYSYGGYPQGILFDTVTLQQCRWAKPQHCSPIFNEDTKRIV